MNKQAAKIAFTEGKSEVFVQKLRINHYRNHNAVDIEFSPHINCLHGVNGAGKTNILDAIYFLGNGRSYFTRSDVNNIPFEDTVADWQLDYQSNDLAHQHHVKLHRENGKTVLRNGAVVKRLSEFIRHLPMVMITPSDIQLVTGSSDERRRMMDRCISLIDSHYLNCLQQYNRALLTRNEALKQFAEQRHTDQVLLDSLDVQLSRNVKQLHDTRKSFVASFNSDASQIYAVLSENAEQVRIGYETDVDPDHFLNQLKENRFKDLRAQRTTAGLHRDDMSLMLDQMDARKFASQGQVKSLTIAMNLAVYQMLSREMQRIPILLLDDVFEKIDDQRSSKLMEIIAGNGFGQIFITDTSIDRMKARLEHVETDKKFFNIERRKPVGKQAISG